MKWWEVSQNVPSTIKFSDLIVNVLFSQLDSLQHQLYLFLALYTTNSSRKYRYKEFKKYKLFCRDYLLDFVKKTCIL
jgi:hypothetical protein